MFVISDGTRIYRSTKLVVSGQPLGEDADGNPILSVIGSSSVQIASGGTLIGTQPRINFIAGSNVTLSVVDDSVNSKVDVTINAALAGGTVSGTGTSNRVARFNGTSSITDSGIEDSGSLVRVLASRQFVVGESANTSARNIDIDGASNERYYRVLSAGTRRIAHGLDSSNLYVWVTYNGSGTFVDNALTLDIASGGTFTVARPTVLSNTLNVVGATTASADITVSGASALAYRLTRGSVQGIWQNGTGQTFFGTFSNHDVRFVVNNTDRAVLWPSGGISLLDATDPGAGTVRVAGAVSIFGNRTSTAVSNTVNLEDILNVTGVAGTYAARHAYQRAGSTLFYAGLGAWTGGNQYEITNATGPRFAVFTSGGVSLLDATDPGANTARVGGALVVTGNITGEGTFTIPSVTGSGYIRFYRSYSGSPAQVGFEIANTSGAVTFQHNANGGATAISGALTVTGGYIQAGVNSGPDGIVVDTGKNIGFAEGGGASYATIFRQATSAGLVLGNGVRFSSTTGGFASSIGVNWARAAIVVRGGDIQFFTAAATTTAVGTDVTMTERLRLHPGGGLSLGTLADPGAASANVAGSLFVNSSATSYRFAVAADNLATTDIFLAGMVGVTNGVTYRRVSGAFEFRVTTGTTVLGGVLNVESNEVQLNGVRSLYRAGNLTTAHDPSGHAALYLGNATEGANYYDNTVHRFRGRAGAAATEIRLGEVSSSTGVRLVSGDTYLTVRPNRTDTSASGILVRRPDTDAIVGYFYGDGGNGNEVGLLASDGNWALATNTTRVRSTKNLLLETGVIGFTSLTSGVGTLLVNNSSGVSARLATYGGTTDTGFAFRNADNTATWGWALAFSDGSMRLFPTNGASAFEVRNGGVRPGGTTGTLDLGEAAQTWRDGYLTRDLYLGGYVRQAQPAATNDTDANVYRADIGSDGTLGPLSYLVIARPSATAGSRRVELWSADSLGYRALRLFASITEPGFDASFDLGSNVRRWQNLYVNTNVYFSSTAQYVAASGANVVIGTGGVTRLTVSDAAVIIANVLRVGTDPGGTEATRLGGSLRVGASTVSIDGFFGRGSQRVPEIYVQSSDPGAVGAGAIWVQT